jgi:hypothetical protein
MDTKLAAPSPPTFQEASLRTRFVPVVLPRVMVPVEVPVPILVAPDPLVLISTVPARVAPPVAVSAPPRVKASQSVAVVKVCVASFLFQKPTVPLVLPMILPEQVRVPVAPSTVQPVAALPPARFTEVAVAPPGPMLIADPAPKALTVVALVLKTFKVPVAEVPIV